MESSQSSQTKLNVDISLFLYTGDVMSPENIQDRARGAMMGAFIGDALVLGPY
ncbi:hypothetical protein NSMM_820026 [Nitrosomonas mobilis]|uniref:Uncharacterized protein n=1 Tax=Nitrosomonas mobilis TaxID=51642 RepID=A0A1G5SK66_9PROT|nr:hypothetical protein NSMM_820026 [Nitrosomonas mobilis]